MSLQSSALTDRLDISAPSDDAPTSDELYEVLSNRRRRYVVHALEREGEPMALGDLADVITAWENDTDGQISPSARKSVYTSLQQVHLPKMDEANVVEFDKDRGMVEPTSNLDDLDVYIEFVEGQEIPWHQYYLGLAVLQTLLFLAVYGGVWPFSVVSTSLWMGFVVAAFTVSAVIHCCYMLDQRLGRRERPPEMRQ